MKRLVLPTVIGVAVLGLTAPSFAHTCPKLVAAINKEVSHRFDKTAADAKVQVVEVEKLHKAGDHDGSEKLARDLLHKLGAQP